MFLIAGVQPRTRKGRKLDQNCLHCGLAQVYERRLDHYFSLFFIPLVRVTKGDSIPWCERCQQPAAISMGASGPEREPHRDKRACQGCGKVLHPEYRFCPHCGRKMH